MVDASAEAIELLITAAGEEIPYVVGDATEEETLISAGIKKARTLHYHLAG
nr:NAD-binding protein [Thermotoga sp. Ku-13t]